MGFGVYVHFPYCRARCPYCDFDIHVRRAIPHARYAAAVEAELRLRAPLFAGRSLDSIYFGGGTPSLWEPACVRRVIEAVRAAFPPTGPRLEVTLEANPDDLPRAHLEALGAAGVNRLSLGAQSFARAALARLGRLHDADDVRRAVEDARAAGIANLSVDLIYGLPEQTPSALAADLDALLALDVAHLSAYQLTVEEHTPFAAYRRRGTLPLLGDEALADMADVVHARLEGAGYVHYEVSSYARPGFRAVHNGLYWSGGEWLGLGCAAHSFRRLPPGEGGAPAGERWATVKNVDRFMAACEQPDATPPVDEGGDALRPAPAPLDVDTLERESLWLGLRRLDEGVARRDHAARFGGDPVERFAALVGRLEEAGHLERTPDRLRLTRRGALLADEVGARFL
jgi:oxygen-independent coproporphyrinogen-3 oxidase